MNSNLIAQSTNELVRLRAVRSYVRREGRMTLGQQRALTMYWERFGLASNVSICDFSEVFGRHAPCILEIGFGMGDSLLQMAQQMPEKNFIGIEVYRPGIGALLAELAARNVNNVRVYAADAQEVVTRCLPDASLAGIQIFFPDPWPKKRHHKRRLITPTFTALLKQKLQIGGYLHLATDWEDYAQQMLQVVAEMTDFYNPYVNHFAPCPLERPVTKFEQRGQKLGHQVWDLWVIKHSKE